MIKYNLSLPLVFLIMLFLLVFLFLIVGKKTYQLNQNENFSFCNHFPFEMYYQKNIKIVTYFRILLIVVFAILIAIPIIFASSFRGSNLSFPIVTSLFFVFSSLLAFIMFMIKPNYLKQFKLYSTLSIVFNIACNGMLGFLEFSNAFASVGYKVIGGFAFALAAFNVILAINPKLSKWDRLEENKNEDGTISFIRPKISPLAFTLWLSDITLILGESLLLISLLLTSLDF